MNKTTFDLTSLQPNFSYFFVVIWVEGLIVFFVPLLLIIASLFFSYVVYAYFFAAKNIRFFRD